MSQLPASGRMRVLIVEDEPLMADAIRDGPQFAVLEVLQDSEPEGDDRG